MEDQRPVGLQTRTTHRRSGIISSRSHSVKSVNRQPDDRYLDCFSRRKTPRMLFGHNSNVTVGTAVVHVQTEDRGANHAFIDPTVHWKGRVLHRRTNNYLDLLPLDAERETTLKARLDDQHKTVIEEIRTGALKLTLPATPSSLAAKSEAPVVAKPATVAPLVLKVELTNAKTWLAGKHATLQIVVRDGAGTAIAGA